MKAITLTLNGKRLAAAVEPRTHLADFLRETQGLTGTHLGCEHGICGACTLLLDGVPVRSCITYAVACDGAAVTTIEGLDDDEIAKELRQAFSREHALQCGYCTPGVLISARDVAVRTDRADEREIRIAMSGNLCRCTGYVGIIRAISSVIESRRTRGIAAIPDAVAGRLVRRVRVMRRPETHPMFSGAKRPRRGRRRLAERPNRNAARDGSTGCFAVERYEAFVDHVVSGLRGLQRRSRGY